MAAREAILLAAERLFAEQGLDSVSHRQISAAAGQGNTAAVNYHFGTTDDLVRAIIDKHAGQIEQIRARMVGRVIGSTELRDWVDCMVRPLTRHLAVLDSPTWNARLFAQVATDPRFQGALNALTGESPSLRIAAQGLHRCLPELPEQVRAERSMMGRVLTVHLLAERETMLAQGRSTPRDTWDDCASGIVDALVGLWLAPVSSVGAHPGATPQIPG